MTIHQLPPELLIEIFVFCSAAEPLFPVTLTHVCGLWSAIVTSSPRIWQIVQVDDKASFSYAHAKARHWLIRSAPLQFDVVINVDSPNHILPLLSPFLLDVDRWRSLTVTNTIPSASTPIYTSFPLHVSLDQLVIHILADTDERIAPATVFPSYTNTSCLKMETYLTRIPEAIHVVPLCFTTVSIIEDSLIAHPHTRSILDFLSVCPQLQSFAYTGWIHDDDHSDPGSPAVVSLPHLHTLEIRSTCSARTILSFIDTPCLSELYLAYLNADFDLPSTLADDGDSDDEANDFSQSPFSDRATGMGLRKLLSRSKPPIRVLEMDYSDMRTKDFKYVFARLVHLEVFSIVASDMSDRVIDLFRPPHNDSVLNLPKLQTLELYHCHRLTGPAVVAALAARVRFTEETPHLPTLSQVTLVGCDLIDGKHTQDLRRKLGRLGRIVQTT